MLKYLAATAALLSVTVIWGSTFPLSKIVLEEIPPMFYLGIRYTLTTLIMGLLFPKQLFQNLKPTLVRAFPLGIAIFFAYLTQTLGVNETTASKTGFFTAFSVVLVPMLLFLINRQKPPRSLIVGVGLALVGLALMSGLMDEQINFNRGDFLVLLCAFGFAVQIILVARLHPNSNPASVATIQFATVALFSFLIAFLLEEIPSFAQISPRVWWIILFLSAFGTAFAYTIQIYAQKEMSAGQAAMILTFEPVFSTIFSFYILKEQQNPTAVMGGVLIVSGMMISQFYPMVEEKLKTFRL